MNLFKPYEWSISMRAARVAMTVGLGLCATIAIPAEIDEKNELNDEPRSATPIVSEASDEGIQAIQRFEIEPGFTVELVAAEPQLANAVAFAIDHKGRFYTSETYRYRSSVLDIRHYLPWLEDDMALRTVDERAEMVKEKLGEAGAQQLAIETEVVRLIEDTDDDGIADRSTVFADGFNTILDGIASGVLPRRDGKVYFTNIPNLWLLEDTDGDGHSDRRESLSRGYGVRFSLTGHDLHGLIMGPDGRLYFSCGDRGSHVVTKEGAIISVPDEGAVFRCEPDGSGLELFAKGLRNPQELAFDAYGNLFTGDNDSDQGDRERLVYVMEGSDSGWRVGYQWHFNNKAGPWNSERLWWPHFEGQAAYILPPIENIDNGPSGIVYNYGVGLPERFDGNIFMCHFNGTPVSSGVTAYDIKAKGAGFELVGTERIAWNCLPTDVDFGPDCNLYFTDWHEGWPKSSKGRIYRMRNDESQTDLAAETKAILGSDFSEYKDSELREFFSHPDMRVRLTAQYELAARGPTKTDVFIKAAALSESQLARIHGIWGVAHLARLHGANLMRKTLRLTEDPDPEIRAQIVKALGESGYKYAQPRITAALTDENPRVRGFAAMALGKLGNPESIDPIIESLAMEPNLDPYLRHAYVMGLAGLDKHVRDGAHKGIYNDDRFINHPSDAVRMCVVLAMRKQETSMVLQFKDDPNPLIQAEVARAANDNREISEKAIHSLAKILEEQGENISALVTRTEGDPNENATYRNVIRPILWRAINANFRQGQDSSARRVVDFAKNPVHESELRLIALDALSKWGKPPARDLVVGFYHPIMQNNAPDPATVVTERDDSAVQAQLLEAAEALLSDADASIRHGAIDTFVSLNLKAAGGLMSGIVGDTEQDPETRVKAFNALAELGGDAFTEVVPIAASSDLEQLRSLSLEFAIGGDNESSLEIFNEVFANGTIDFQRSAIRGLANRGDAESHELIATLIGKMTDGSLDPAIHVDLIETAKGIAAPEVQTALQDYNAQLATSPKMEQFVASLRGGDAAAGEKIFKENLAVACLRCHQVGGTGGEVGPALDGIGAKKSREYLLESILDPAATIAEGYQMVLLSLSDGMFHAGTVVEETEDRIRINSPAEGVLNIDKSLIETREDGPSGMPPGMEYILSKKDLRDLVEYLASLK